MYFAPHILYKQEQQSTRDEFGRTIVSDATLTEVCKCRCDDNSTEEFHLDNGVVYRPTYHIVCEGSHSVNHGDYIVVKDSAGEIRAEGKAVRPKRLNCLNYSEIWI